MAIWQYNFFVLPKVGVLEYSPSLKFNKEDELFDDSPYWEISNTKITLFYKIGEILTIKNAENSDTRIIYGEEDANCFTIIHSNGITESVSFRIDFRSQYEKILVELIDFFNVNDLIIIDENLEFIKLNIIEINNKIQSSSQYRKYKILASNKSENK
jgi:hypothetical protein